MDGGDHRRTVACDGCQLARWRTSCLLAFLIYPAGDFKLFRARIIAAARGPSKTESQSHRETSSLRRRSGGLCIGKMKYAPAKQTQSYRRAFRCSTAWTSFAEESEKYRRLTCAVKLCAAGVPGTRNNVLASAIDCRTRCGKSWRGLAAGGLET